MKQAILKLTDITPADLGNRNTVRENSSRGEDIVKIPISKIVIRKDFNVRQDYGDIEGLATSLLENGQIIPGRVDVLANGTFLLTDGHRRFRALCTLKEKRGYEDVTFKAIVNSTRTTELDRIFQMFLTQDNKQLSAYEIAELIKRLMNLGLKQHEIALKIGKTDGYISQMLSFANESPIIKDEVKKGNISVSAVVKLQKEIPVQSDRIEAVQKAIGSTKKKAPVSVKEVTKSEKKKVDKYDSLAKKIIDVYDMPKACKSQLISLIKEVF